MSGVFIAFEGGDGAGKSTQAQRLYDRLRRCNRPAVLAREPGSTELGDYLREYLVNRRPLTPQSELLLFEAARAQLMADIIAPSLAAGKVVIADRFTGSTIAYQGYGRRMDLAGIEWLNDFATGGRYPDLTILLDIAPEASWERVQQRRQEPGPGQQGRNRTADPAASGDRFEEETAGFHQQVRNGFIDQWRQQPDRWALIDAAQPADAIAAQVWAAVAPLIG